MMYLRLGLVGLVTCVGVYLAVALVIDVIDHAPNRRFISDARHFFLEHGNKEIRNQRQILEDKWQTAFIPYLRGIYKNDFECHGTKDERYVHNHTYPPNFSCKSSIKNLTAAERSQTVSAFQ